MNIVEEIGKACGGYAREAEDGSIYIPVIQVQRPGCGEGGRFLDGLPRDRTIKVPGVISALLREMLERRGFKPQMEWAPEFGEWVQVHVREASP